jgi:Carboxypeptidase regulatory-like domain/TonB-dependent Receptor Plug Domain
MYKHERGNNMYKLWCSAMVIALSLAISAPAQTTGVGTVTGVIIDSSSSVVPGAAVTLVNAASGEERHETTTATGDFVFAAVPPGSYMIRVQATGFRQLERTNNVLIANSRLTIGNMKLQLGDITQSVQVTAEAAQVQTESSDKSELVDSKEIENVAVRGHDPISFLGILPGVQKGVDPDYLGGPFGSAIPSFQGLPTGTNDMMADGVNGGDSGGGGTYAATVNLEGVSEIQVLMGNYNAEYGRAGGTMINMITKSGGTKYHGSAWYFKRHEEFDATNYFNNLTGTGKPIYRFNIAGGQVGGPVKFPKTDMRNKMFFFALYERGEVKNSVALERWSMPSAAERAGDFSKSANVNGSLITVKDPLTGVPFPGNIIPSSRANISGLAEENILPLPNVTAVGYNYIYQEPYVNQPRNSITTRVDYHPTDSDTISVTYKYWSANQSGVHFSSAPSTWGWLTGNYAFLASQGTLSYTHAFNSSLINEMYIGGQHDAEQSPQGTGPDCTQNQYNSAGQPTLICGNWNTLKRQNQGALAQLGQFNNTWNPLNFVPQASSYGNPTSYSAAQNTFDGREPLTGFDYNLTASDTLTYIRGPHTFKAGFWFEKYQIGQAATSNFSGIISFANNSTDPTTTGYAFANAYLGHFFQYTEDLGRGPDHTQRPIQAAFVQDTWKISHKLTMDIGLRIYYSDPWPLQTDGVASALVMSKYDPTWRGNPSVLYRPALVDGVRVGINPITGVSYPQAYIGNIVPGTGNTCTNLSDTAPCSLNGILTQDNNSLGYRGFRDPVGVQFDPRIGFAYDPFGDGKTAIRAAFGEFHEASQGGTAFDRGPDFVYTRTVLSSTLSPSLFQTAPLTSPIAVSGTAQNSKIPVVTQYLFGFQRDIRKGFVLTSQYVGNTQRYVLQNYNYNLIPLGAQFLSQNLDPTSTSGAPLANAFLGPTTQGYTNMTISHPAARTRYDSWQNTVHRRFASGLEIDGNFTWARGSGYSGWSQLIPVKNFWGPALTDQKLVTNITYVYSFPKISKWVPGKVSQLALDNWQISGITTFASGFPKNISLGTTNSFNYLGGGDVTAQVPLTCNPELPHGQRTFSQFFNTACISGVPTRGQFGSILNGNEIRGPGFNNWDVSLTKNWHPKERSTLMLRWEVFNILNHAEANGLNLSATLNPAGQNTNLALGQVTSTLPERRMQFTLKASF